MGTSGKGCRESGRGRSDPSLHACWDGRWFQGTRLTDYRAASLQRDPPEVTSRVGGSAPKQLRSVRSVPPPAPPFPRFLSFGSQKWRFQKVRSLSHRLIFNPPNPPPPNPPTHPAGIPLPLSDSPSMLSARERKSLAHCGCAIPKNYNNSQPLPGLGQDLGGGGG